MALNPVAFTEKVVSDFLTYQLTTYPLADRHLQTQLRDQLNLDVTRNSPLLQGPFVSLSRSFAPGATLSQLVQENVLHKGLELLSPYPSVRRHQENAFRAIHAKKTTLVSTGTGSGKTECFLYPIISRCLDLRDAGARPGITAVLVYPMNALAEDQLDRLRELLCGTGVTFGLYVGKTPETRSEVTGHRLEAGSSRADYVAMRDESRRQNRKQTVHPPEEACSREEMRETPPRILLTNVKQLELLLTRSVDLELFDGATLDFLVFDEAHTYSGAQGAETACLIRRLRAYCGKQPHETVCIATSATIADPERGTEAGRDFASRFFGVDRENVELVDERYEEDPWAETRQVPPPPPGDIRTHLKDVLEAVEETSDAAALLPGIYWSIRRHRLGAKDVKSDLYEHLSQNELVYQLAHLLEKPQRLSELLSELESRIKRPVSEEELLIWLALGATATRDGRPRLRPVLHAFVRGVGGAVVTFPRGIDGPVLHLSPEDAQRHAGDEALFPLPVKVCTTCGQHYFSHTVNDFAFAGDRPSGGELHGDGAVWVKLDPQKGASSVTLYDRLIGEEDADADPAGAAVYLCRHCGALHPDRTGTCRACTRSGELVRLMAVKPPVDKRKDKESKPQEGRFGRCLSCNALGKRLHGRFREPARPIRAVAVSDVHVLAQSMLHNAERKRLLVFADNRQDAAFQAGWMQDHARRYRLRSLMMQAIPLGGISVADLTVALEKRLDADDALSEALLPEVWRAARKEGKSLAHLGERRIYLRFQIMRELAPTARQRIGLEPWGRLKVTYDGLDARAPFFQAWSGRLGIDPERLVEGVAALLDQARRKKILHDGMTQVYTRFWREGDPEVLNGYVPSEVGGPVGLRLTRRMSDNKGRVTHWLSTHPTLVSSAVRSWGVPAEDLEAFLSECWTLCTEHLGLLVPVTLTIGSQNKPLPGCEGVRQVDAGRLWLERNDEGTWSCNRCRMTSVRRLPGDTCMGWRCGGTLVRTEPDPDNYDLRLLDQNVSMLKAREHSAQVPADDREVIENVFKGESEAINTLVCTPTLELGVDIGNLDGILMRNVPPKPANYWQRAGRAGRRQRMAVNLTYARPVSHDLAYFADPLKLLTGRVDPPRFNMRNGLMVAKHVRSAVLTVLFGLAREGSGVPEGDRRWLQDVLHRVLPRQIRDTLFDEQGNIRTAPLDVTELGTAISQHRDAIMRHVRGVFGAGWPISDAQAVSEEALAGIVDGMPRALSDVIGALKTRLDWATSQITRLGEIQRQKGVLDPEDEAQKERCERLIRKLKGLQRRRMKDAEGYDDTNTYAALAAEGFLPGYGLETGAVKGTATIPRYMPHARDYELPRPPAIALREYFPGNILYANGHRFIPRYYRLGTDPAEVFQVELASGCVKDQGASRSIAQSLSTEQLRAVEISDVVMPHQSHISDEEEYRFQPPATVYGVEQGRHDGGTGYDWGDREVLHRTGLRMRLVNVGASAAIDEGRLGFPICGVCGQSRSPFASQADLEAFSQDHRERCMKSAGDGMLPFTGLYADVTADSLTFRQLSGQEEAYTLGELLRRGAAQLLDMELDDLHLLVIGKSGSPEVDLIVYDPMPGGSGLLEQLLERWGEAVAAARAFAERCPGLCERACVDCLMTFRNAFYHRHLNRRAGAEMLARLGGTLSAPRAIPATLPRTESETGKPQTPIEDHFRHMLEQAGFPPPICQRRIALGRPFGDTVPDFFYEGPDAYMPGIALYLDGMSRDLHGDPETRSRDQALRDELRNTGYEVFSISSGELHDRTKMTSYLQQLARRLERKDLIPRLAEESAWFEKKRTIRLPLLSLRAAAGGFGEQGEPEVEEALEIPETPGIQEGMFVARVVGRSMEPLIPDGSLCVFKPLPAGSRQGKIVLAQHRAISDVDHDGGTFTVKRYRSVKRQTEDGWAHEAISLEPVNRDYPTLELESTEENPVRVVAEFVMVLPERTTAVPASNDYSTLSGGRGE